MGAEPSFFVASRVSLLLAALLALAPARGAPRPPDLVVILVDDMGFSDIGCYGGEIPTPNIDRLAAEGVRLSQFYNTGRCCPTRAAFLTGLWPHQAGMGWMTAADLGTEAYRGELLPSCPTIAERLRRAGYSTYLSGKWHLTRTDHFSGPKDSWPRARGFDRFFGTLAGGGDYFAPAALVRDDEPIEPTPGFYYTEEITAAAERLIRDHARERAERPLFLYVAHFAPHRPLHAPRAEVERFLALYEKGWDEIRAARLARQKELGLFDTAQRLSGRHLQARAWTELTPAERGDMALRMAVYAAQVAILDRGVGRIVRALEEAGRLDDTLILFLSDNGGCAEGGPWGLRNQVRPGDPGSNASYGLPWANASNTPFREFKHWVHEGGIATPLIARWPKGIPKRGGWIHTPGHVVDIVPTLLRAAGVAPSIQPTAETASELVGVDLLPALRGETLDARPLFWEHEGNRAVRLGSWKLVAKGAWSPWELYDLEKDRAELEDLADDLPARVDELARLWDDWARSCSVHPLDDRDWGERLRGAPRTSLSTRREFTLSQGDSLERSEAPVIIGRALHVVAELRQTAPNGVIVAQGGSSHGWSLHLVDGRLMLSTRHEGRLTEVRARAPLPAGHVRVEALVDRRGSVVLTVNGARAGSGTTPGRWTTMPTDGLTVGADPKGLVGRYGEDNALRGTIERVRIELRP